MTESAARQRDVQVIARESDWARLREEPRFVELMRLARVANALSLAYDSLLFAGEDLSPYGKRGRHAGLFYAAALLKEGLHTARSLGRWFREVPQYREGFGAILSDPAVLRFESDTLKGIRDELVFHFDRDAIATGLRNLPPHDVVVASYPEETGPLLGETYFNAADDATLNYLFGGDVTDKEYLARLEEFMEGTAELLARFLSAAHRLIAIGLYDLGCVKRRVPRPPPDSEQSGGSPSERD